jgi:NADPH2:quinone reductase
MRAWLIDELTGIDRIHLGEIPDPVLQSGEAILQIRFAALNPADRYLAERQYPAKPTLPHILGRDGMGTVIGLATGVNGLRVGDRRAVLRGDVGGNRPGTFAQQVAVPAEYLVEIPSGWRDEEAAGATLVYLTACQALTMWGALPPNSVVLVTGASGGVGVATVQLAAVMGHTVFAISRSPEKSRRLKELGAAATFDPSDSKWWQAAKAAMGTRRVELAIDNVGGRILPEVIETLGDQGKVSVVGRLAGPVPNFNTATLFFRRIRIGGVAVGAYTNAEARAAWEQVLLLLARTGARPLVDSVFPFEELPKAFKRLAEGPMGKVLLQVAR